MKLRFYFTPGPVVVLLAAVAILSWYLAGRLTAWLLPVAVLYSTLAALAGWAWIRIHRLEQRFAWARPGRLLILAPHEDDCVISAGGLGLLNHRLGGATRIAYLARDENPGLPEIRVAEAKAAWAEAGVDARDLLHIDLLPPLFKPDPARLHEAAAALRRLIDDYKPTVIVIPMFEGGHVHHDMVAGLLDRIVQDGDTFEVFEAPEYGPCVSLRNTPHRIIALCARWLFGLVSYYGAPDGIDDRRVLTLELAAADLETRRRMLAAFRSQNAPSLVATRAYPDRLVKWTRQADRRQPFAERPSYMQLARLADRLLPARLSAQLLPGPRGTLGRPGRLTDWRQEWGGGQAS
jgi:LmbE family N-acetylglucosaminyl deacetylase